MKFEDLTGKKFQRLTVVERVFKENKKETYWLCVCDCGKETTVMSQHLKDGHTSSCGCLQKEKVKSMMTEHGMSNTKLFKVWRGIIDRTMYPSSKSYKHYGQRGITICSEWYESFETFYKWAIENGYKEGLTLDRVDVDGNYTPDNCRWTGWKEQENNRTNNHIITYKGETHTMKEWSEIRGIKYSTLSMRINKWHWDVGRALNYVTL